MGNEMEILQANYWEHLKYAKELAEIYGTKHPKYIKAERATNDIINELNEAKDEN